MRTIRKSSKESGVILLLILGFMAMFAVMIVTFIMVTTNMADSANSSVTAGRQNNGQALTTELSSKAEAKTALKTVLIGTNDENSPIAPFSIGENLYGETPEGETLSSAETMTFYADDYSEKNQSVSFVPSTCELVVDFDTNNTVMDFSTEENFCRILEEQSGTVVTFGELAPYRMNPYEEFLPEVAEYWKTHIQGTSAIVTQKRIVPTDTGNDVKALLYLTLLPSADLDAFRELAPIRNLSQNNSRMDYIGVRFNPPAFAGTGAGGFRPQAALDGETIPLQNAVQPGVFRLPYALWGNAAAPDKVPYNAGNHFDARTFFRHLGDSIYTPFTVIYNNNPDQQWSVSALRSSYPTKMNPGYTAPDSRTMFLAQLTRESDTFQQGDKIIPSFHRPDLFKQLTGVIGNSANVDWFSIMRKMTPRPLPTDHWKFTGGNPNLVLSRIASNDDLLTAQNLAVLFAGRNALDVDNDGDGTKEGIWIPSGLPIRSASDGTPYATFYSFTILDMDGRVNVNTAGNWDQLPYSRYVIKNNQIFEIDPLNPESGVAIGSTLCENGERDGNYANPYESVDDLDILAPSNYGTLSPWFNIAARVEGRNDLGNLTKMAEVQNQAVSRRGSGFGPSELNLYWALQQILNDGNRSFNAVANMLWNRNRTNGTPHQTNTVVNKLNDSSVWNHLNRWNLVQPGNYYADPSNQVVDNTDQHQLLFNFTDPIYDGPLTENADPEAFSFPWRGKTFVPNYRAAAAYYPTFDFTGTVLRTYDPLGNDFPTYSPRMTENPYLNNPYHSSKNDTPYSVSQLETLLRMFDWDAGSLDAGLVNDLANYSSSDFGGESVFQSPDHYRKAQRTLTTISSDIPVPAQVFPFGPREDGDGVMGIYDLIRRCVIMEIYKNYYPDESERESRTSENIVTQNLLYAEDLAMVYGDNYYAGLSESERASMVRRIAQALKIYVLYDNLSGLTFPDMGQIQVTNRFFQEVNQITDRLYSYLPEDIRAGRRLDLNALSHKACWLDYTYNGTTLTRSVETNAQLQWEDHNEIHRQGLVERMKFARGLYILISALTWHELNAKTAADFYLEGADVYTDLANNLELGNYFEGSLKKFLEEVDKKNSNNDNAPSRNEYARELFANRLAQWCVNVVDFSDPDATMTPFFYDPTPFNGWWESIEALDDPQANELRSLFDGDFFDRLATIWKDPDFVANDRNALGLSEDAPDNLFESGKSYAKNLANWLTGAVDGNDIDFGFRRVWGMERPDLLLTETLNFHDLGIANTKWEELGGKGDYSGDSDGDFDQVRRPQGSTYLELYSAANPKIPQSTELYDFDSDANLWKLDLSRMTPEVSGAGSPYSGLPFPVWRIAISCSCAPHPDQCDKQDSETKRQFRKLGNSILERLIGTDEKVNDAETFSFQPRQFNGLKMTDQESSKAVEDAWLDLDICASNILGPVFVRQQETSGSSSVKQDLSKEIELDRIVWMTRPLSESKRGWRLSRSYPDETRLFWRIFEQPYEVSDDADVDKTEQVKAYIFPNQYFVIGPEDERSIGSLWRNFEELDSVSISNFDPNTDTYFGVPSLAKIILNDTRRNDDGVVVSMMPMINPFNSTFIRPDKTHEVRGSMRVGTYTGITENGQDLSYKRGLNISEPLWTDGKDPYLDTTRYGSLITKTIKVNNYYRYEVTQAGEETIVPDTPFDIPRAWGKEGGKHKQKSSTTKESPIAEDYLFGQGTVPGYKSAFLQRVADPNQPYHPLLNPYLTVDWNMMDLTVYNGEGIDLSSYEENTKQPFVYSSGGDTRNVRNYVTENNLLTGLQTTAFGDDDGKYETKFNTDGNRNTDGSKAVFSSRQWGNPKQKLFYPSELQNTSDFWRSPNPWARALKNSEGIDNAGLENAVGLEEPTDSNYKGDKMRRYNLTGYFVSLTGSEKDSLVVPIYPRHTLGWDNNRGKLATITGDYTPDTKLCDSFNWYEGLETFWFTKYKNPDREPSSITYFGSPKGEVLADGTYNARPHEHLIWNDAPFSNPMELTFVPASHPARFGLEFVRVGGMVNSDEDGAQGFSRLFITQDDKGKSLGGRSLGSGTRETNLFGYAQKSEDVCYGPYLNFFQSSDDALVWDSSNNQWVSGLGTSLNLARLFDLVTIPSSYTGTQQTRKVWTPNPNDPENVAAGSYQQMWNYYTRDENTENPRVYYDRPMSDSTLREPGKINLNTISAVSRDNDSAAPAWAALLGADGSFRTTEWSDFLKGRKVTDYTSLPFQPLSTASLAVSLPTVDDNESHAMPLPVDSTLLAKNLDKSDAQTHNHAVDFPMFNGKESARYGNLHAATDEMQKLSGLSTNRSNVFAVWMTIGYFKVERAIPGENIPLNDPDGESLENVISQYGSMYSDNYKYGPYYRALYPDGYTYAEELGTGTMDGGAQRTRAFYLIDRSIPFDFRRGRSTNWEKAVLLERVL